MSELPTRTLTFLFTDIEGSTKLWNQYPQATHQAILRHDGLLRRIIRTHNGKIFKTTGDSFYSVFDSARQALAAALESQLALLREEWEELPGPLKVRMALHSGIAREQNETYTGSVLNRTASLLDSAHGEQVLLSQATRSLLEAITKEEFELLDLGEHRLKDLGGPEHIYQLVAPGLRRDFPPLRTLVTHLNNLPAQAQELIGREPEIARAGALLNQNQVRMLTFTGPGGTGKTRLSLQVAASQLHHFEDGGFFVDLSSLNSPKQILVEVAKLFDLREHNGPALIEDLKQYLRNRQILLVLDNFEHLMAAASLVSELLAAAPGLKVIVSSRQALKAYGELEFAVPPLATPDLTHLPPFKELIAYPALVLFGQRAQLVKPGFQLTAENTPLVAEICGRLDGLPLAIELAAAHSDRFELQEMLAQLNNRLELLTRIAPDLPVRQQSLQGAIEWGYALLDQSDQIIFARLAVFSGGCTEEAAEAVCNPEYDPELDTYETITSLVNKSLLRQLERLSDGETYFAMLETIREYALEQLAQRGEEEQLRQQHAAYYMALAEKAEAQLTGAQQVEWFHRLEREHNNIRAIMNWALAGANKKAEVALRIGGALWRFWAARGYLSEGRQWLEEALAIKSRQTQERTSATIYARAFNAAGILARDQGDYERAIALLEESLALQRSLDDRPGIASALNTLGTVQANLGNYVAALAFHEETLALRRELNDRRGVAVSLCNLAALTFAQDNYEQSIRLYEEALVLLRELGDIRTIARVSHNLGHTMLVQGNLEKAESWIEESLALYRELGDKSGIADVLILLADVTGLQNKLEQALNLYQESLMLLNEVGDNLYIAACLEGMAETLGNLGKAELAAQLYGSAGALREVLGAPLHPADRPKYEQSVAKISAQLEKPAFEAAWAAGRAMSLQQAITIATLS